MFFKMPVPALFPLSRTLLCVLLLVYALVVSLQLQQLPLWFFAFSALVILWRINILREKWRQPHLWQKILMMLGGVIGMKLSYGQWFSVEPMVALLMLALTLKLLEIRIRRDYVVVVYLCYFAIACSFLFDQSFLHSVLGLVATIVTTMALLQVNSLQDRVLANMRLAVMMLLHSVALMLVLLLVLPRLNPLWSVPLQSGSGVTGVGDSLSPGDFGNLIQSNKLALRVTFTNEPIARQQMYWRGLVFEEFDGRRWTRAEPASLTARKAGSLDNTSLFTAKSLEKFPQVDYEIIMEPSGRRWLYGLPMAQVTFSGGALHYTEQTEILRQSPVQQRLQYPVTSYVGAHRLYHELTPLDYQRLTALPEGYNPKARAAAQQWRAQAGTDKAYIDKVLAFYRDSFIYTLSPPTLGKDSVDEFLFDSQRGFCEHFASSFTVMMRNVGIPARVVVGYQGGQWNQQERYLSVYQRDAHAWTEVWLAGEGWTRIDPTAAVSPERVEQGLEAALNEQDREQINTGYSSIRLLASLNLKWQNFDYRWQRWVLGYDAKAQKNILERYLGDVTPTKLALAIVIPLLALGIIISLWLMRDSWRLVSPEKRIYQQLQKRLSNVGVKQQSGESIAHYCDRVAQQYPQWQANMEVIKRAFDAIFYQPPVTSQSAHITQQVKRIKQAMVTLK